MKIFPNPYWNLSFCLLTGFCLAGSHALETDIEPLSSDSGGGASAMSTNGTVYAVAAQEDGAVVVGGEFSQADGQARGNIARFQADGTLDTEFLASLEAGVTGTIYALAVDANGGVFAGGIFNTAGGQSVQNLVRFLPDGSVDPAFAGNVGPRGSVYSLAVLPDGRIVAGGEFNQAGGKPRSNLAIYHPDGGLAEVSPGTASLQGTVRAIAPVRAGGAVAGGQSPVEGVTGGNLLLLE